MRRTKEVAQETRNQILDAAERVFVARGVAGTTFSDIADAAHVTRGAIYWHFKNKGDLLASMLDRVMLPAELLVSAVEDMSEPNPLSQLRAALSESLLDAANNPQTLRILSVVFTKCEFVGESSPILNRCQTASRELRRCLQGVMRNAIDTGQLPLDLDVEFASTLMHSLWAGVLRDWILDPIVTALRDDAERIADTWLDIVRYSPTCRIRYPLSPISPF